MQVLTSDWKPFPSIACSGLMSCTTKSRASTHNFSFSWAEILHLGWKNQPSFCCCKELDDDDCIGMLLLILALHLLLCCCKWVVLLSCQITFYQWIAWHTFHMSCIILTFTVFGRYKMKLIPYRASSMFIFWKITLSLLSSACIIEESITLIGVGQSQPTTDWTHTDTLDSFWNAGFLLGAKMTPTLLTCPTRQ